jgi:hypothetical protein
VRRRDEADMHGAALKMALAQPEEHTAMGPAIYVLHCFPKKTQQTSKRDIDLAQRRLKDLLKERTA